MNTRFYILDNLETLIKKQAINKLIFVGSLGFEDRTLGALQILEKEDCYKYIFLIPYSGRSDTKGHIERRTKQQANRKKLETIVRNRQLQFVKCPLDSPQEAFDKVMSEVRTLDTMETLVFDFSTMPTSILYPLFRSLWRNHKGNFIAVYSIPYEYTSDSLYYESGQPGIIADFIGKSDKFNKPLAWIPILGFAGNTALKTLEWGRYEKVIPIVAYPGYRATYVDRVIHENRELLKRSEVERVYFSSANNPFRTIELIEKLMARLSAYYIVLSPMGPKPHSLGVCLTAIENDLKVVYAQPWAHNPSYSIGYRATFAYWLRKV